MIVNDVYLLNPRLHESLSHLTEETASEMVSRLVPTAYKYLVSKVGYCGQVSRIALLCHPV